MVPHLFGLLYKQLVVSDLRLVPVGFWADRTQSAEKS